MSGKELKYTVMSKVKGARNAKKLTQDELAERVQVTRQTIIAIEKGNYVPSVLLALRLADELGKEVEEIFSYEEL